MTTNSHPAHGPVSLDRLHQIREILSKASAQSDGGNLGYAMADAVKVINGAIAARNVEPIYQVMYGECWRDITEEQYHDHAIHESPIRTVCTVPPSLVVPDIDRRAIADKVYGKCCRIPGATFYNAAEFAIDEIESCRAAMLQGTDGKPELTVWYGSMPETNGKTNWTAMLHRKGQHLWEGITIDRSEYPDRVRYEADRMRHLIGELPDEPDILSYDADAHSGYVNPGNSPIAPDRWIPVSERMPERDIDVQVYCADKKEQMVGYLERNEAEGWFRFASLPNGDGVYCKPTHWMPLPAAPQQEVK